MIPSDLLTYNEQGELIGAKVEFEVPYETMTSPTYYIAVMGSIRGYMLNPKLTSILSIKHLVYRKQLWYDKLDPFYKYVLDIKQAVKDFGITVK